MQLVENPNSTFTTLEFARLAAYRAAVAAGFYTDWDGSAVSTDTELLAWLRAPRAPRETRAATGSGDVPAYPFTAEERQRLEHARAAVASGVYGDDLPAVDSGATPDEQTR